MTATARAFAESVRLRVATADQLHTLRRIAERNPRARTVTPHPWYQSLGMDLIRRIADRTASVCPHVGPGRPIVPMYALVRPGPMEVQCRDCWVADPPRLSPVEETTCDRCSVYTKDGLVCGMLPVGPLLLMFGVCTPCATELGAKE